MKALSLALVKGQRQASGALPEQATLLDAVSFSGIAVQPGEQLWVAIHFPSLALDVCRFDYRLPAVVLDASGNRQIVHSACAVAQDYGITPGLSLNAAHALRRNLDVKLRDPLAEYSWLKVRGEQLLCFTPAIALGKWHAAADSAEQKPRRKVSDPTSVSGPQDNADSLLLEVSSSLRLYGGLDKLLDKIRIEFAGKVSGAPVVSVAPCPAAALLMARNGLEHKVQDPASLRSVLGGISLRGADLPVTLVDQLMRCGLRSLRDCWRLPRQDLGRRFGASLLHYLDRICAEKSDPVDHIAAPLCFRQRIELPADTRQQHLIVIAAEKLLAEVQRFLQMHSAATERVQFDLWHVNRAHGSRSRTSLVLHTAKAGRRPERFLPQLGEQLERLVMADDINAVSVMVDQVIPFARSSEDLFERRDRQQQDFDQLVDVLCARLGQEQVYTLDIEPDHRPEYAWRRCQLVGQVAGRRRKTSADRAHCILQKLVGALPPRPLWLLQQPCAIRYTGEAGPLETERIEAGWWVRADVRRDYRVVGDSPVVEAAAQANRYNGQHRWIYRDLKQTDVAAWYVHGLFA